MVSKLSRRGEVVVEHILEVRHEASGSFVNLRGKLADYVRSTGFFPHWKIDPTHVNFHDGEKEIEKEGAFVGFLSVGFVTRNTDVNSNFVERANEFWTLIREYEHYALPALTRFGCRTKIFFASRRSFDQINRKLYFDFLSGEARALIGGEETDLQLTVEFKDDTFEARLTTGPLHKGEAREKKLFDSESKHFDRAGLFLDIDYFKKESVRSDEVAGDIELAVRSAWLKANAFADYVGI